MICPATEKSRKSGMYVHGVWVDIRIIATTGIGAWTHANHARENFLVLALTHPNGKFKMNAITQIAITPCIDVIISI